MQFNRYRSARRTQISIFLLFSAMAASAWAFTFMISEQQVNSMLQLTFPYEARMGDNNISLANPLPHFYESSQEIGITLSISLKDQVSGQTAKAKTLVRGGVRFDNKQQQLQLVKPKIASLEWLDKPANANQDLLKQVTQLVGQDLPVIVLLDIKQLTGNAFTPTLSDIKIKKQGIEVSF